jgi:hypothetical protein
MHMATTTGIAVGQTIVLDIEQTSVTRYVALADTAGGFALPDPSSRSSDRHFVGLAFPGVTAVPALIFYRTRHTGTPRFSVRINEASLTQYTFTDADPPERSWHEIIPATLRDGPTLRAQNNELIFGIGIQDSSDTVVIGDVAIFYTSNELTIKVPIVLTTKA